MPHKISRCVLFFIAICSAISSLAYAEDRTESPVFRSIPALSMQLSGPLRQQIDGVTKNWLVRAPDKNPAMLQMLRDREKSPRKDLLAWSGEFAGKYLTSGVEVLRVTGDAALKTRLERFVRDLIAAQATDGYLGPYEKKFQLTGKGPNFPQGGTWDAWNHYHAMYGLLAWYDYCGDANALKAAQKIGDLLCEKFLGPDKAILSIGSPEMNQAVVHSLTLLYRHTKEKKFLELAQEVVAEFELPGAGDYLRTGLHAKAFYQTPKPRWESLHPIMGLAQLYWVTGNADYRSAFEHHWWSIAELDRHNNGGFSSGEQAQGNPFHPGAIETCCTIAWMATSVEMLRMTGNSIVADELELSTLNQVVGLHSPEGDWCTYDTPMDGQRIPSTESIAFQIRPGSEALNCCSVNAARGFGMLADWAVMQADQSLIVNYYGPGQTKTKINNVAISLTQKTVYPREGQIEIIVDPATATEFELKLRVPHWSEKTSIRVNGNTIAAISGSYASIRRTWKAGDKIEIDLDFSLRYWVGERECQGKSAVYRGPLLLAFELPSIQQLKFGENWTTFGEMHATTNAGAIATFTFEGDSVEWNGQLFDDAGKAQVLIDNRDIAVVDQYGPTRNAPFVWRHAGLGPGKHTMTIKVLGEKSPASKNNWVNITQLNARDNLPTINATAIPEKIEVKEASQGFLTFDVKDSAGRSIRLRDFGSAGQNRVQYASWLPVKGPTEVKFSKSNPSRTSRLKK